MKLLDLFCGQGGAGMGYHLAGFDVTGIDTIFQERYPFNFIQSGALDYLENHGHEYDVIHASPPCQGFSVTKSIPHCAVKTHPNYIHSVRSLLKSVDRPYVIENVVGAPLISPIMLCGIMFDLKVFRHRLFECSLPVGEMQHIPHSGRRIGLNGYCCVMGGGDSGDYRYGNRVPADHRTLKAWSKAMGIHWMTKQGLAQAIPPMYTRYIGGEMARLLK